jgi:hypothetical protein
VLLGRGHCGAEGWFCGMPLARVAL